MKKGSHASDPFPPEVDVAGGWIKVYRSMLDHGHLRMPENALKVWLYLLLQVNYKPGGNCAAGEGWVTYRMMREGCCEPDGPQWSDHTINNALGYLESNGYIRRVKTKSGAPQRIRIINWHKYQGQSPAVTTAPTAEVTAGVTAEVTADKQEGREGKEGTPHAPRSRGKGATLKPESSDDARTLATALYEWLKETGAMPADKGFFMKQVGLAQNQLLSVRSLPEWLACLEWAKSDGYWAQHLGNLGQLGRSCWPQYARRPGTQRPPTSSIQQTAPPDEATRMLRELRRGNDSGTQPEAV